MLHRFEEEELVILAADEAEVDRLVARVTGTGRSAVEGDEDEEDEEGERRAPFPRVARRLLVTFTTRPKGFATTRRTCWRTARVSEASVAVFAVDYLPELDEDHLAAVGRVTRRLLGALGADEALEDEIRHQAEVLCRLIAPSAGEAQRRRRRKSGTLARLEVGAGEKGRICLAATIRGDSRRRDGSGRPERRQWRDGGGHRRYRHRCLHYERRRVGVGLAGRRRN